MNYNVKYVIALAEDENLALFCSVIVMKLSL